MPADFTHLHLHTLYSLLDGAIRLPDLMRSCEETGMKAVAVTDHGNMFGVVNFYQEAKKHGIKPIDRKSTRLNSSHSQISYAVFCLKKKKKQNDRSLIYN